MEKHANTKQGWAKSIILWLDRQETSLLQKLLSRFIFKAISEVPMAYKSTLVDSATILADHLKERLADD